METATVTTEETENLKRLYRFDETEYDITFNGKPGKETPVLLTHKLRKPTLDELAEWEKSAAIESVEVSRREDEIRGDDEAVNAKLWKKIILQVKGYRFNDGVPAGEFRTLTDSQKEEMRTSHKVTAVRGLYWSTCEIDHDEAEESEEEGMSFSGEIWRVKQIIRGGAYTVIHTLREPTESERLKFRRSASSTTYTRGSRKAQSKTRINLRAYVELYDLLLMDVEGGTVNGDTMSSGSMATSGNHAAFLKAIDPIYKRQVIQCLIGTIDAELQD